jgi:hypothetical protein
MVALFRKEARQVLIAHAFIAVLYTAALLALASDSRWLLVPQEQAAETYFAATLIALVQGLLIGLGIFGLESWGRTEPYLLHRGMRASQVYGAKVAAGLVSMALVTFVPIATYALWQLVLFPTIEGARATGLLHLAAGTTAGAPAIAIGVIVARLRKSWFARWLLALLGGCTLLLFLRWAARPIGAEVLPSAARFAAIQVLLAALLLAVGSALFRSGDDVHRPWRGRAALLAAAVALALFWMPYAVGIGEIQSRLRSEIFEGYPDLLEQPGRKLLRVVSDEDYKYWEVDAQERRTSDEPLEDYRGLGFDPGSYLNLFDARGTPLTWNQPWGDLTQRVRAARPFQFEGPVFNSYTWFRPDEWSTAWIFLADSRIAVQEKVAGRRDRLRWFDQRGDGERFSEETVIAFARGANPHYGTSLSLPGIVLADLSDRTLWGFERSGDEIQLSAVALPQGDTLERIERLHSFFRLRVGLYEPLHTSDGLIFVGQRDRYILTHDGFLAQSAGKPFEEALARGVLESEAAEVQAWRLEPSRINGLAFHLDVVDVRTGEVALAHDFEPRTARQRMLATTALALSLARPPLGEVVSFAARPYDERVVSRNTGPLLDPFVGNGARPWLALAVVALGLALAVSTWRWIGGRPEDRAVRWLWAIAVAALGLPAWVLCRVVEPSRRVIALRAPASGDRPTPLVRTARLAARETAALRV